MHKPHLGHKVTVSHHTTKAFLETQLSHVFVKVICAPVLFFVS